MNNIPKEDYKKIMELMPIVCVDLIFEENNKILLVLRKNSPLKGEWWIPGGRVRKNEKLVDAVKRKAKEELNLNVGIEKELGSYEYIGKDSFFGNTTGIHTISIVFKVKSQNNKDILVDKDHVEYRWFKKEDITNPLRDTLKKVGILQ